VLPPAPHFPRRKSIAFDLIPNRFGVGTKVMRELLCVYPAAYPMTRRPLLMPVCWTGNRSIRTGRSPVSIGFKASHGRGCESVIHANDRNEGPAVQGPGSPATLA
jgi:hypothetical protein